MTPSRLRGSRLCWAGVLSLLAAGACQTSERGASPKERSAAAKTSAVDPVRARPTPPPRRSPAKRRPPRPRPAKPDPACATLTLGPAAERKPPRIRIADATGNLDHFFEALHGLASGDPKRRKVRVAFYGDSNGTMDFAADALRRFLGARFGHGGHGYVSAGQAVAWYQHREIRVWNSRGWRTLSIASRKGIRKLTSHAGHVGMGRQPGAFAQFESAKGPESGAPEDQIFSTIDVFYVCYPFGGKLGVEIDKELVRTVLTRCKNERKFSTLRLKVKPGRHRVRLKALTTRIAALGAAFENDSRGTVVDGLGVGALNVNSLLRPPEYLYNAGLKARGYDLVILHTGTNMWGPGFHPRWAKAVIERIRHALGPKVSILLLSPPAFGRWNKGIVEGHPRMKACGREKAEIARVNHVAFWDYFRSMGGLAAPARLRKQKLIKGDLVHLKPAFHKIMMKRLGRALMDRFRAWMKKRSIRCPTPGAAPRPR